jgi:hypothetical protein
VAVNPGRVDSYTATLYELGASFLYVDGHCHYWVSKPSYDDVMWWRPFREGVLTPSQESILHDIASYDDFAHHAPSCKGPLASDGSPARFWDGISVNVCNGALDAPEDWPGRAALFAAGTDMSGPVRIEVGKDNPTDNTKIYPWPLAKPPSDYEVDDAHSMSFGQSVLITAPEDVAALRALRAQAVADTESKVTFLLVKIYVEPKGYVISIRDDVPFTDARGMWSPP